MPGLKRRSAPAAVSSSEEAIRNSRQRLQNTQIRVSKPESLSMERLNAWGELFLDERLPRKQLKGLTFPQDATAISAYIQSVLNTARDLLLAANVPCFEPLKLLRCEPDKEREGVVLGIVEHPVLENYQPKMYRLVIESAISITRFMLENPPTDECREKLFGLFETHRKRVMQGNWSNPANLGILEGAYELGVPFHHLGAGVYQLGWGSESTYVSRSSSIKDAALCARIALQKHVTAETLRNAGLPAPEHRVVADLREAKIAAEDFGWPVVVKPGDLDRGEGVHLGVEADDFERVFASVAEISPKKQVLVERQVSGICYRLFIIDRHLLYAVKRRPMGVIGDGESTVSQLVAIEYARQQGKPIHRRTKLRPLDDLARSSLADVGLSEGSILETGQFAPLRSIQNDEFGGLAEDVREFVHPENVRIAIAATALCGMDIAGVDIISDDISKPWMENGAIINEVNYAPAFGATPHSRRHLQEFVQHIVHCPGRIPVKGFVGGARAFDAAQSHATKRRGEGVSAFLTSPDFTADGSGEVRHLAVDGLYERIRALVASQEVEELIFVVQDDALLHKPFPIEGIDSLAFSGERIRVGDSAASESQQRRVMKLLSEWIWER